MTRRQIDTTHNGLPAALPIIRALPAGNLVALYDTGSAGIAATAADIAEIPTGLVKVFIDQGFTGSPNMSATVRDCENGAWLLEKAVNKTGWNVPRPTLYVGFPNTAQQVADLGWKGDVWLVHASNSAPTSPPSVPAGLNVVGVQWNFANPNYDESVIFDESWPEMSSPAQPFAQAPPGQWKDPAAWTWQQVVITGRGLDNVLYTFEYREKENEWVRISTPIGSLCFKRNSYASLLYPSVIYWP